VNAAALKPFAAVLAILALVFGLAFAFRSNNNDHPTLIGLEAALVCTTCHEPLDMSDSPLAMQMEKVIRVKIAAGWTTSQIENYFVAQLGPQVLAIPKQHGFDLLAWLLPLAALVFGAAAVGIGARSWLGNRDDTGAAGPAAGGPRLAPSLELRVDQELARFDT
jgi:cytochrome c-type biogenesis protein CcmH